MLVGHALQQLRKTRRLDLVRGVDREGISCHRYICGIENAHIRRRMLPMTSAVDHIGCPLDLFVDALQSLGHGL